METRIERSNMNYKWSRFLTFVFFVLIWILFFKNAHATCSSPISRTNNAANSVLTSSKYNTDVNTVYNHTNDLSGTCLTDATVTSAKLDTSDLAPWYNAVTRGFKCEYSNTNQIAISRGWISTNGNLIATTTDTSVVFGCSGCSAEVTGTTYYVALQSATVPSPLITTTAPASNGYNSTNNYICKFFNDSDSNIASSSISQWVVNRFTPDISVVEWTGIAGYGSTNNKIPYYNNRTQLIGDGITDATSAANGLSFTFNASGRAHFYQEQGHANAEGCTFGFSKNSNQLTTAIQSITNEDRVGQRVSNATGGSIEGFSVSVDVNTGDVIRPHTLGSGCADVDTYKVRAVLIPTGAD